MCDELANDTVARALSAATTSPESSLLPFEKATVVVDNIKITSNIAMVVRSFLGKVEAKKFYTVVSHLEMYRTYVLLARLTKVRC